MIFAIESYEEKILLEHPTGSVEAFLEDFNDAAENTGGESGAWPCPFSCARWLIKNRGYSEIHEALDDALDAVIFAPDHSYWSSSW